MTDFVFGGMTRPPTVGGVPQGFFAGLIILTILAVLMPLLFKLPFVLSIGGAIFGGLLYVTGRLICESDHYTFRYLQVRAQILLKSPGRRVGRGLTTYAPAPLRKR